MKRILLYIAMAGLCLPAMAQITGGGNPSQPTPKTPEKASITEGAVKGNVNLFNGLYQTSQALGTVSTPTGLSYTLTMSYQSSVVTGDNAPFLGGVPYGEGWSLDIPTISVNLAAYHKFTRYEREHNTSETSTTCSFNTMDEVRLEGELQWFAPTLNIPGVASGRMVFKGIDVNTGQGLKKAIFVLHEFDTYIEAAFDGKNWTVSLPDGTVYAFEQVMYDVVNGSNQRMTLDDGNSGTSPTLIGQAAQSEAQKGASRWLVTSIFKPSQHQYNRIHFYYKEFGKFNFHQEDAARFLGNLNQVWKDTAITNLTNVAKDVLLQAVTAEYFRDRNNNKTEATDYLSNVIYEKLDLVYEEDTTLTNSTGGVLASNKPGVTSYDGLYNKQTVYKAGTYQFGVNFTNWALYHARRQGADVTSATVKSNPYILAGNYQRQKISSAISLDLDHNFCESPLIKWQADPGDYTDFKPGGELYEIRSWIHSKPDVNCTIDFNIVCGSGEESVSTVLSETAANTYNLYRTNTLFTTFGNMKKWNTYFMPQLGIMQTSNFFVMPQLQNVTTGFMIQVGPGNSDNDFSISGADLSQGNATGITGNLNWRVQNSYYSDPGFVGSTASPNPYYYNHTYKIPYNFGGGWPWAAAVKQWSVVEAQNIFNTWPEWGSMTGKPNYRSKPTLADSMKLASFEMIRYSKKPLVLRTVNYYVMNGKTDGSKQQTGGGFLKLVSSKTFTYAIKDLKTYASLMVKNNSTTRFRGFDRHAIVLSTITNKGVSATINVTKLDYTIMDAPKGRLKLGNFGSDSVFATFGGAEYVILTSIFDHLGKESRITYYPMERDGVHASPNAIVDLGSATFQYTPDWEGRDPFNASLNPSLAVAGPQITRMYYLVVKDIKTYTDASHYTTVSYAYASKGTNDSILGKSNVYFPLDSTYNFSETSRRYDVFSGSNQTLGFEITTETKTNTIRGSSVTLTTKYYHHNDGDGVNTGKEIYQKGHLFGRLYKIEVYNNSNTLQKSTEITYEITKAYKNGFKRRGDAQYMWDYSDFQSALDTNFYKYRAIADTNYAPGKNLRDLLAFYNTRDSYMPFLEGIYYNKIDSLYPDYLHSFFIKKAKEVSKVYQSEKTMTNTTEYAYYEANYRGVSPTIGFKYILDNLAMGDTFAIKYEPSWQVYSVKKYSDALKGVTEKTENFYYYDLIQKHNVFQTLTSVNQPDTAPYIYPRMHPFIEQGLIGLGMCQFYGVRDIPFETRVTKEAPGQNTHRQSSYFLMDTVWKDDYNLVKSWYLDSTVSGTINGNGTPPVIFQPPCKNQGTINPNAKIARAAELTDGLTENPAALSFSMFETPLYHLPVDQYLFPPGHMNFEMIDKAGKAVVSSNFVDGTWLKTVFTQVIETLEDGSLVSLTPATGAGSRGGDPCAKGAQMLNIPKRSLSGYVTSSITAANMANVQLLTDYAYAGINTLYSLAMSYDLDPDSFVNALSYTQVRQIMTDINHGTKGDVMRPTVGLKGDYQPRFRYDENYITIRKVLVQIDSLVLGDFSSWVGSPNIDYPILHFKDTSGNPFNTYDRVFRPLFPYSTLKTKEALAFNQFGQVKSESDAMGVVSSFDVNTSYTVYAFMNGKNYTGLTVKATQVGLPITTRTGISGDVSKYTKAYQYSDLNQLTRLTDENSVQANFEYDGANRLYKKKLNSQTLEEYTYHTWNQDAGYTTADQKATQNYVQVKKYHGNPDDTGYTETRAYLDPLARAYQTVAKSKVNDSVLYSGKISYDAWDRPEKVYESFVKYASGLDADLAMPGGALYSRTIYENDAFSRPVEQAGLGDTIPSGNHNIINYYAFIDGATLVSELSLTNAERNELMPNYSVGGVTYLFSKVTTQDQDYKSTIVYTDALGRKVATKSPIDGSAFAITLFMYDNKGLLSKVINPKKQVSTYTNNIMGWVVLKRNVDTGPTYFMYNQTGQVVLEQDSMGKTSSARFYRRYIYDDFGRLIRQEKSSRLSGPAAGTAPFEARTGYLDDYSWTFVRNISGTNRDYTYFLTNAKKEKEVFYDTKPTTLSDYPCASSFTTDNALGKVTATISYDNNNTAVLYQLFKYNTDGRMAQEVQQFNKNGMGSVNGSGQVEDLFARIVYTWGVQQELIARSVYLNIVKPPVGGSCVNVEKLKKQYYYTYDNWGRLKEVFYNDQEVGSNTESGARKVAAYTYNITTGQVKTRDNFTFLDADYANINTNNPITYTYDHKHRMTGMTSNLFDWLMYYDANQPSGSGVPGTTSSNYNGNINSTLANYKLDSYGLDSFSNRGKTWYAYMYDGLNRLTDAYGNMQNSSGGLTAVDERATYDSIGNIRTLKRSGNGVFNGVYTYAAIGNRLMNIKDGSTTRTYSYTLNGALILDSYHQVGMNAINDYGRANLPFKITKTGGAVYNYLYNNKDVRIARFTTISNDFYLIDELGTKLAVIDASGLEVKEWYIDKEASTMFDNVTKKEYPVFLIKDHLGNIRLSYSCDDAGTKKIQNAYDYYPYGKLLRNYDYWSRQRYLTAGNERDAETGWDYRDARFSDADIGRFLSVDPFASNFPAMSGYSYCANNPIRFIDPDGKKFVNPYTSLLNKRRNDLSNAERALDELNANSQGLSEEEVKARRSELQDYIRSYKADIAAFTDYEELVNAIFYTFQMVDPTRFDRFDKLTNPDGSDVLILVYLSEEFPSQAAETRMSFSIKDNNPMKKEFIPIKIKLYHGMGAVSLANEIGDIEYVLDKLTTMSEITAYANDKRAYWSKPETHYSFDVEYQFDKAFKEYRRTNGIGSKDLGERSTLKH